MNLKDISWVVSEREYREDTAYSQSTLSTFAREGFSVINRLFDKKESPSLLFGSVVDCLLTGTHEEFVLTYAVRELPKTTDSLEPIIRELYTTYHSIYKDLDKIPVNKVHDICDAHNYYANPKYHNYRLKLIKEQGSELYNALASVGDKILISEELYREALECRDAVRKHPIANKIFEANPFETDVEVHYQLKFKGEYEGIPIKGMMDAVLIDHKNKKIIPCDLKTMYKPCYQFPDSYKKWRYDIQSNMYTYLLKQNLEKAGLYSDYTITNFLFIVISRDDKTPIIWKDPSAKLNEDNPSNWRNILKELHNILSNELKVPEWLDTKGINDITTHLEDNGKDL